MLTQHPTVRSKWPWAIVATASLMLGCICVALAIPVPAVDDAFYKSPAAEWAQTGTLAIPCATGFLPQMENTFACYPPVFQIVLASWYKAMGVNLRSSIGFSFGVHALHALLMTMVAQTLLSRFTFIRKSVPSSASQLATCVGIIHLCNLAFFDRLEELALVYFWAGWLLTANRGRQSWLATALLQGLCLGAAGLTAPWVGILGSMAVVFRELLGAVPPASAIHSNAVPHPMLRMRNVISTGIISFAMALVWYMSTESAFPGAINDQFLGTMRHLNETQQRGDLPAQLQRLSSSLLHSPGQLPGTVLVVTSLLVVLFRRKTSLAAIPREVWALGGAGFIGIVVVAWARPEAYTYVGAIQMVWLPLLPVALLGFAQEPTSELQHAGNRRPQRRMLAQILAIFALLLAVRDVGIEIGFAVSLERPESPNYVTARLQQIIPNSARVAATARHWHAFQGRNVWREAFFSSLLDPSEVTSCDWLVLPKNCGTPLFLDRFELVEQVPSRVPSHHTYAYDLYRRSVTSAHELDE